MSRHTVFARATASLLATTALATAACATRTQIATPAPTTELVALAADPDTGEVGRLSVTSGARSVDLTVVGASTSVTSGGLGPVTVLSADEIQRMFGGVMRGLPPAAAQFNLYFETGGDTLTAASQAMLADVIAAVSNRPAPSVSVIGHTDTTGTAQANAALGGLRAETVRTLLVRAGLDDASVEATSHGEADPLVQTPDNTDEPRNRRVEVTVR